MSLKEYKVPMRGKATTLCLIWERMREGMRQRDKKWVVLKHCTSVKVRKS